jgi:hypothetical protein
MYFVVFLTDRHKMDPSIYWTNIRHCFVPNYRQIGPTTIMAVFWASSTHSLILIYIFWHMALAVNVIHSVAPLFYHTDIQYVQHHHLTTFIYNMYNTIISPHWYTTSISPCNCLSTQVNHYNQYMTCTKYKILLCSNVAFCLAKIAGNLTYIWTLVLKKQHCNQILSHSTSVIGVTKPNPQSDMITFHQTCKHHDYDFIFTLHI